jgi:D-3-phosphoglycerate dehydrogenase
MILPTLAITIRSFNLSGPAMELVKKKFNLVFVNQTGLRLEQKDLISAIKDADYVLAGTELFNRSVLDASKKLKIISRIGIGIDNIDLDVAKKNHVTVFFTPNAPVQAVAEHTLALILSLLKHIPQYNSNMRNGDFHLQPGSLLSGKYIGIVGMGRIGSAVASSLSSLGCNIRYYDPFLTRKIPETWEKISSLEDLSLYQISYQYILHRYLMATRL